MLELIDTIVDRLGPRDSVPVIAVYATIKWLQQKGKPVNAEEVGKYVGLQKSQLNIIAQFLKELNTEENADLYSFKPGGLAHAVEQSFLAYSEKIYDFKIDRRAVKIFVQRVMENFPEQVAETAQGLITQYYSMCTGRDKFWSTQPFLPRRIVSNGIWPLVVNAYEGNDSTPEIEVSYDS